jgi:GTP cyclohydrolase II
LFAYINPDIRVKLVEQGVLVRFDAQGNTVDASPNVYSGADLMLNMLGPIPLPIRLDERELQFQWYAVVRSAELARLDELAASLREKGGQHLFASLASSIAVNSVLVYGDGLTSDNPLVRVHSSCLTGDIFGSQRCECGPQFLAAVDRLTEDPAGGMIIYMSGHEGRGIGLWAKAVTYLLQDAGEDTYQANRSLGLPDDCRDFTDAAAILRYFLKDRPFRLMTNNPKKIKDLSEFGLKSIEPVRHVAGVGEYNRRYLAAKRDWGHALSTDDLAAPER